MAQQEAPRCPLGFTGTPPIGHPTIPGIFGAGKDEKSQPKVEVGSGSSVEVQKKKAMSPYLVLTLDALFLFGISVTAIYWAEVRAFLKTRGLFQ